MVKISEFAVEGWMDRYENDAKYNLAETCCASISFNDLLSFSDNPNPSIFDFSQKQTYGAIRGTSGLRSKIAKRYASETFQPISEDQVLVTNGAIQANFLALYTNVGPGDHVICHYPTYQQLYSVPESFGAEVSLWKAREDQGWDVDLNELRGLIKENTKVIIINNPQNPTGAVMKREKLQEIVNIAGEHDIIIHSDEVYRPLFHGIHPDSPEYPPSILSFGYEKTISTGSMSKAYSLAGIRLGWIASCSRDIVEACASNRHYTTISVSQVDDAVASYALSTPVVDRLLQRNLSMARANVDTLEAFVKEFEGVVEWVRPQAGTTAFLKFVDKQGRPVDDTAFCQQLLDKTGAMLVPGSECFGEGSAFKGYVRLGYVQETQVLADGLQALRKFMRDGYERVPVASQ
ncbi:aspartate/tyrosine/aromatic aminotransferase [Aspergillus steynii IBT 23096]|uniref:Aspartate/tyrosine/aromatic aminotransferase n=1 Tax=Aspergillus steynii IBT 23096 TaxID=1392250 RepID=A0A2I2GSM3_9EURO|nr:aspartate/tyrosine/aromatic aminotransferase [Aspergillus steynii IBT 23096]PLB55882.1 aspartate/tyrosine/aromatic aminotransferase [Aspergillus steynii IBT 23096]